MKLRIRGNSLRLRLTQGEVTELAAAGVVEEAVAFAPGRSLVYAVRADASASALAASLEGTRVEVVVPLALAKEWAASDRVGLEGEQAAPGGVLRMLVEKDFKCLTARSGEDDGDAFPNPREAC